MSKITNLKIWPSLSYIPFPKIFWKAYFKVVFRQAIRDTASYQVPISFELWFNQFIVGNNRNVVWPVHASSTVSAPHKIYCGIETSPGYMSGCYIQGFGGIHFGDYTQVGPNLSVISSNHDLTDTRVSISKAVYIGEYCWLGSGCVVLSGVKLGDHTIVAAGDVVTKSFEDGHCVVGGNPAKVIKSGESTRQCNFTRSMMREAAMPKCL